MPKLPSIAVWDATAACPMKCEFCFGPTAADRPADLSTAAAKKLIDSLVASRGVKTLIFSGGDPLSRADCLALIRHAKKRGLKTVLHTTGLLVTPKFLSGASGHLDRLNLPLDGSAADNLKMRRNPRHYAIVSSLLETLSRQNRIKLSVTTVVSKANRGAVVFLANYLRKFRLEKWFVYQFRAKGRGAAHARKFEIPLREFNSLEKKARKILSKSAHPKSVVFKEAAHDSFDDSYFLVSNAGKISSSRETVFAGQPPVSAKR